MVEAVVSDGVIPLPQTIVGEIAPLYSSTPAPLDAVPMPKCVAVPLPPVPAGNDTVAAGETLFPVTTNPAPDRATVTRAYDVQARFACV